jgi:hypothetical protein
MPINKFMNNYYPVKLLYNPLEIINVLSDLVTTTEKYTFKLDQDKIRQISRILNINFVQSILYFDISPEFFGTIHLDIDNNTGDFITTFSLNIPITQCGDLFINWFKPLDTLPEHRIGIGPSADKPIPILLPNEAICVDSTCGSSPIIVNIQPWHNAENRSRDTNAKFINIRFYKFITIQKALEITGNIKI